MRSLFVSVAVILGLSVVGCATQDSTSTVATAKTSASKAMIVEVDGIPSVALNEYLWQDYRTRGPSFIKVSVNCLPGPVLCGVSAPFATYIDPAKDISVNLVTPGYAFDPHQGIVFDPTYFTCTRNSDTQYTCTPNNPPTISKYTITVVGLTPYDPFVVNY